MNTKDLANLIFPDIKETLEDLERRYPERDLPEGAEVTRFAPSPTGFLHTGSLFTSFVSCKIANQSGGVFYFRLEDTDTKREIKGSEKDLINQLKEFGINIDEGVTLDGEKGNYGPYAQSKRAHLYKIAIKHLIEIGRAYPCFCTKEELDELRTKQTELNVIPGYYGEYAVCRNLSVDEAIEKINAGIPYIIRFKSLGNHENKINVHDEIRGDLELSENDQDIVILKGDGLPTYHFAHAIDDHFMRTTVVTRGEEWLPSLPIHLELFDALGFKRVKYAHLPVIMKLDENGNKRKLSKRKDNEAAVSYFLNDGYPTEAILTYLMSIANSNFEEYTIKNKGATYHDFTFSFNKMSLDGALFDIEKLKYFSKEYLGKLNKDEFFNFAYSYAKKYDEKLLSLIEIDHEYFKNIINIEREKENPRKDYCFLRELYNGISYMYHDIYCVLLKDPLFHFETKVKDKELIISFLKELKTNLDFVNNDEQGWFASLKEISARFNFAINNKEYKANPEAFNGNMADASGLLRVAVALRSNTPNLYAILNILGKEEFETRIDLFTNYLATI